MVINGKEIINDKLIVNTVNSFYANQYALCKENKILKQKNLTREETHELNTDILNEEFTEPKLEEAIKSLKAGKQPGVDYIFPEFIKHLGHNAKRALLHVLNSYWNLKENHPSEWVKERIIPTLKKGKQKQLLSSYRPIALTSAIVKVQEKMLLARLKWYLEKNNNLAPEQAGFRENRSTSQQIFRFTQEKKETLNMQESVLAVFIDFKGAYDTIWREKLINKLKSTGVRGKMLNWLRRFLVQRWISTKFNNTSSKYK
jgi:hypothetical protein